MPRHGRKVSALFAFNICAVAATDRSIRATAAILRQDYINIYAKRETSATVSIFPAVFCPRSDIPFCISPRRPTRRVSRGRHLIRRFAIAPLNDAQPLRDVAPRISGVFRASRNLGRISKAEERDRVFRSFFLSLGTNAPAVVRARVYFGEKEGRANSRTTRGQRKI